MFKGIVLTSTLLVMLPFLQEAAPTPAGPIPPEALNMVNPVKPTAGGLAKAKKTYGYDCMMCHGKEGKGDGELGASMKLKLTDFSDPATLKNVTDGELFYVIKNGRGQMPAEGQRGKPDDLWNMVNYMRSMSGGSHAAAADAQ